MISLPTIDVHMHLAGTGCQCSGCWIHPNTLNRFSIRGLRLYHKITKHELSTNFDQLWVEKTSQMVTTSQIDYGVVLGFDLAYENGKKDDKHSQLLIPPEWVFSMAHKYSNLLPGPSINPFREDALDRLDYCIENGAVLIKWIPGSQLIDTDKVNPQFYEKLTKAKVPLLIHCGGEMTFKDWRPDWNHLNKLKSPLEAGCKVICAHSGVPLILENKQNYFTTLVHLLESFENLWVDNSALCSPSRSYLTSKLAKTPIIQNRTLYGSDWPVPSLPHFFAHRLGFKKFREIRSYSNTLDQDIEVKRILGYPDETLVRSHNVLANLEKWIET